MRELSVVPTGATLIKPNLVAAGPMFPHAHTRPEFGEGVIRAVQARAVETGTTPTITVGERCGITIPSRMAFRESGFDAVIDKLGVNRSYFEEEEQVEIPLTHEGRLRDYIYTPRPVAEADTFINLPKFKAHPWTTVTFSLKNYIGIQDDRHRLIDHDYRLNEKIADLQHVVQPQFIAVDGITAGEGRMLTPLPFDLGLIIMGNSQVALDAVCCQIIGISPRSVDHIRLAEDHGFGTTDLARIRLSGDVSLPEAQAKARGFRVGLIRVEEYFRGTHISAYAGPPPSGEGSDYCWGGCPGAIEEAIEILRQYDSETDAKMPRLHVVFGAYDGEIPAQAGERVVFIGDCASWRGTINDQPIQIANIYRTRDTLDPRNATHEDILAKLISARSKISGNVIRLEGCPVSVAEQVLALVYLGDLKNPYLDPSESLRFGRSYLGWKRRQLFNLLAGKNYHAQGETTRGEAAPVVPQRQRS